MSYEYLKALHLISIVCWFAGLFYIVRLFIYHTEAQDKSDSERAILSTQFKIMSRRLWYGITWPACIATVIFGASLVYTTYWPMKGHYWLHLKLTLVLLLLVYQFKCHKIFKALQNDTFPHSAKFLRVWNEVATLFLFAIVFLAVIKSLEGILYGVGGIIALGVILMAAIKFYRKVRRD
ncbi:CopD family protein [Halobacteriovorax sp. HFRX-2_2]|uniref:CopD family protein n=1 Tax=unclassified Halobacteriovorax TaxID=2639665 RepID=UPI00371579B0